jgi:hypothetical protein
MNDNDRPKTAAAPSPSSVPAGPRVRDLDAERVLLGGPIDSRLPASQVQAFLDAVQDRMNARGATVVSSDGEGELLARIAGELLDVAGWALVMAYAHPTRSQSTRAALNHSVWLAARAWQQVEDARRQRS